MSTIVLPQVIRLLQMLDKKRLPAEKLEYLLASGELDDWCGQATGVTAVSRRSQQVDADLVEQVLQLEVDPNHSMSAILRSGDYDQVDDLFHPLRSFPPTTKGKKMEALILHLGKYVTAAQAAVQIRARGFEPADLRILLSFGAQYPNVQRGFPIVALHPHKLPNGSILPCLKGNSASRSLAAYSCVGEWSPDTRFLVLRP